MKNILGISAFYHDSAACVVIDGKIIAAAQEERFTRVKHTADFPTKAIEYCLMEAGLSINEIDHVVFYDKPLLKFERLLETYYAYAPKGLLSFVQAMPVWIKEKVFLKKTILTELKTIGEYKHQKNKLLFTEHHLSHAASTYFASPFNHSAILVIDGVGEWATITIAEGVNNNIKILKEQKFPHSLGLLYSAFTYFLGFKVNSGEYKLMGLAPYGDIDSEITKEYINKIKIELIDIKEDGSVFLNQKYFNYATGLKMINEKKWEDLFQLKVKKSEEEINSNHCHLAIAIQSVTEEIVIKLAREALKLSKSENLCLAGGVALNCVANGKLQKTNLFKEIFIQPASGDAGGALGAALSAYYMYLNSERKIENNNDSMNGTYLGPYYSDKEIETMLKFNKAVSKKYDDITLNKVIANLISEGNVIGWFQGRMEFGPRSLGNRSIIADPRNLEMQKKLNLKIKYREGFRPFAPSVLVEDTLKYFDLDSISPYMLLVAPVQNHLRKELPLNYNQMVMNEKLYTERSSIQSVTHVDFSARVHTVDKNINPKFWNLINEFKTITGESLLINTSFNVRGEPPVCSPSDAYQCFMNTEMDYLVIENYVLNKSEQIHWVKTENYKEKYTD